MAIVVQKYGGSSVADVAKVVQVAAKAVAARRRGDDVVVVVSAMGKTTDGLLALAKETAHAAAGQAVDPPRRELDMLLSTGERVSMSLLSIAMQAMGCDAISFTGSQSGIITNDRHFDARIIEVRPHRIEDELARGRIVIVAGYQGMSYRREITTLGRGGSDTTAVALAAALGAERCEIYSDVDGVYSADPRVVPEAVHLPGLDLAVMQEMAEAGAKVLNAQAVEWARKAKIAIFARKTTDPVDGANGANGTAPSGVARQTIAEEASGSAGVRAVVGLEKVVHAVLPADLLQAFAQAACEGDVPLLEVTALRGGQASAAIPLLNVPDWSKQRVRLAEACPGVVFHEDKGLVSLVGDSLASSGGALPKVLGVLASRGLSVHAWSAGPLRISAVVDGNVLAEAQRALHQAFVLGR